MLTDFSLPVFKINFSNHWKGQIIVEAFEHNVPKFEVVLCIILNKVDRKVWWYFMNYLREATKKSSFFSGPATKAFTPPPQA